MAVDVDGTSVEPSHKLIHTNFKKAHQKFRDGHEEAVWKAAKHLGSEIVRGTLKPCLACTRAKAKQKNVPKVSVQVVGDNDA